jgi:hypothetical protein
MKKSLSMTCTWAARPTKPVKPKAIKATISLLRHTGVLLANKGLEDSWTL